MTPLGWIIMTFSIASVVGLTAFCLYRVLILPPVEIDDIRVAPLGIETPDSREPD